MRYGVLDEHPAYRGREGSARPVEGAGVGADLLDKPVRESLQVFAVGVGDQNRELVTAESGEDVGVVGHITENVRYADQHLVAECVSESVVDGLESVHVQDDHPARRGISGDVFSQLLVEVPAIGQAGQRVSFRQSLEFSQELHALGNIPYEKKGALGVATSLGQ